MIRKIKKMKLVINCLNNKMILIHIVFDDGRIRDDQKSVASG